MKWRLTICFLIVTLCYVIPVNELRNSDNIIKLDLYNYINKLRTYNNDFNVKYVNNYKPNDYVLYITLDTQNANQTLNKETYEHKNTNKRRIARFVLLLVLIGAVIAGFIIIYNYLKNE